MLNETELRKHLRWQSVDQIPKFPFRSFDQTRREILNGKFGIAVDNTKANAISSYVRTRAGIFTSLFLSWVPWLCVLVSVVLAVVFGKWGFLWGMLFSVIALLLANPFGFLKPFRKPFGAIADIILLALTFFALRILFSDNTLSFGLFSLFLVSYAANRAYYIGNEKAITRTALESEPLFIYLYQDANLGLRDNNTGETYWNFENIGDLTQHIVSKTRP